MSRARAKGTSWETQIVRWLRERGRPADRSPLRGTKDQGDIVGIPGVVLEAKSCKSITLSTWVDELLVEIENANAVTGAVVVKRRGTTDVGRAYAVLPFALFEELLKEAGR